MNELRPHVLALSHAIVDRETAGRSSSSDLAEGMENVFVRLQELVEGVVGAEGFRAVVARAAHLSQRECTGFDAVEVEVDPSVALRGIARMIENDGLGPAKQCTVALLRNVLGLLCQFIGAELTLRIVHRAWRDLLAQGARTEAPER